MALRLLAMFFCAQTAAGTEFDTCAIEALSLSQVVSVREPHCPPPCVAAAEEILRDSSRERIGLREISQRIGVHPVYLARAFRRHRGRSVGESLRDVRLADAARQILDEQRSIARAACLAGFADQAHLTRVASQRLGLAPGRLRRRLRAC